MSRASGVQASARPAPRKPSEDRRAWERLAAQDRPSWYLDPLVALQKREIHQHLIRKWVGSAPSGVILKTDLFEDAWGQDRIIFDLFEPGRALLLGTDIAHATAAAAQAGADASHPLHCFVSDVRYLPMACASVDLVLSISTLDHFDGRVEFERALDQLCAAVRPRGTLVITLDNPLNPLYPLLRLLTRTRLAPFRLGYTPASGSLARELERRGFEILDQAWLIHNPRIISTALILLLRRVLGRRADPAIRRLLSLLALQDRLPTRRITACFHAVYARRKN